MDPPQKIPKQILDLPPETLQDIFRLSSPNDLVALSLVSKRFRDIAAHNLYRSFHIVFPDDKDNGDDLSIDELASGLDTLVTSDYNYAKFLREITLETLIGGDQAERTYRQYHYNVSCGKFLNTLFFLTLRRAKALETFRWDIRVELSRKVFKALHAIASLRHLHIRMQIGPSLYKARPAIGPSKSSPIITPVRLSPPVHSLFLAVQQVKSLQPPGTSKPGESITSKGQQHKKPLLPTIQKYPPTFSAFDQLESLAILDMDTLDYVAEIKECIEKSSSTLKTLKLSFSEDLARMSRKPPPEVHSDDESDQDDEFEQLSPLPGLPLGLSSSAADPDGSSNLLKSYEQKKMQEAVLGQLFGIAPEKIKIPPIKPEKKILEDPTISFIQNLSPIAKLIAKLMMSTIEDESELSAASQRIHGLLTEFIEAAKLYLRPIDKTNTVSTDKTSGESAGTSESITNSMPEATNIFPTTGNLNAAVEADPPAIQPGLFDKPDKKEKKEKEANPGTSNPEDIDIEEPELEDFTPFIDDADYDIDDHDTTTVETQQARPPYEIQKETKVEDKHSTSDKISLAVAGLRDRIQLLANRSALRASHHDIAREIAMEAGSLQIQLESLSTKATSGVVELSDCLSDCETLAEVEEFCHMTADRLDNLNRKLDQLGEQIDGFKMKEDGKRLPEDSRMGDYVRSTRGLTLKVLAIYLLPIKASVLSRSIDLTVLQDITLLNVGQQTPFWNLVTKENQNSPIPLRIIHTDHVTLQFLCLVNRLERVEELFLLERGQKQRVEPTTPQTTVTMEQIRALAIKKHTTTLKRLSVRNDASEEWDLDVKSAILLCQRAKALEELAVKFGTRTMHTLLQFMPGLESLRALHTIEFHVSDACLWVMREFRKFAVDNISHNPGMKLEFLGLNNSVERLVRHNPSPMKDPIDVKGKGKAASSAKKTTLAQVALAQHTSWSSTGGVGINSTFLDFPNLPFSGPSVNWDESDDEDMFIGGKSGLRLETVEDIDFHEINGVKIFEKEILYGKL